jgi:hypothetical protein
LPVLNFMEVRGEMTVSGGGAEVAVTGLGAWGFAATVVAQSARPPLAGAVGYGAAVVVAGVITATALARVRALYGRKAPVPPSGGPEHAVQDAR